MLIDSFLLFQELDLLEIRLKYLYEYVDQFLIVESGQSFNGLKKSFNFEENINRYKKYLKKIKYYKINDFHQSPSDVFRYLSRKRENSKILSLMNSHNHYDKEIMHWVLDSYHRECIHLALDENCNPSDYVIVSDLDEIPSLNIIKNINKIAINEFPIVCKQFEFKYYLNSLNKDNWYGSIIAPHSKIKNKSLNILRRESRNFKEIKSGGYHFTSVGGEKALKEKIENWGHQEFNLKIIKKNIKRNLSMGRDVFYRFGEKRNNIIDIKSHGILDKKISNIISEYKDLIILKNKEENLIDIAEYAFKQFIVYIIKIKNNPRTIIKKIFNVIYKFRYLIFKIFHK